MRPIQGTRHPTVGPGTNATNSVRDGATSSDEHVCPPAQARSAHIFGEPPPLTGTPRCCNRAAGIFGEPPPLARKPRRCDRAAGIFG
jgi:hypothetical protein